MRLFWGKNSLDLVFWVEIYWLIHKYLGSETGACRNISWSTVSNTLCFEDVIEENFGAFFFPVLCPLIEESPMDVYGSLDFFSDTVYQMDIRLMADMRTIYVISNHRFIEYKKTPQASAKVSIWISHVRRLKIHKRAAIPLEIDPRFLFRDLVCYEFHSKSIQTNPVNQQKSCPTTPIVQRRTKYRRNFAEKNTQGDSPPP